jgi:hypothetical protein
MEMVKEKMEEHITELTLLLLYLTSWTEKDYGCEYRRSWKGYDFEVLNQLVETGMIAGSRRSKSIGFTEIGEEKAKKLVEKYFKG